MRRRLDSLLAAPGLTRNRFIALALVSLAATAVVVASAMNDGRPPYGLLAAAYSRAAPVVSVHAPAASPAPATRTVIDPAPPAPAAPASSTPVSAPVAPVDTGSTPAPTQTTTTPAKQTPAKPAPVPVKQPTKVKHVFVVYMAGADADATWGPNSVATYLNGTLRPQGALLSGYKPLPEGDLASLIAMTSGQKPTPEIQQGCPTYGTGCVFGIDTLSLPDQLVSKGLRWRAYEEDLGNGPDAAKACRHPAVGAADDTAQGRPGDEYTTRHNPFVYYRSLTDLGECLSNDLPLTGLPDDLKAEQTTPNLSFIAPNLCNGGWETPCADGSSGGLAASDAFLSTWVPQILASPAYKADGMLLVVTGSGVLAVSQFVPPGAADQSDGDPYSVLRYVEDLFGLDYLGGANTASPLLLGLPKS